jgi:hypothetical protein
MKLVGRKKRSALRHLRTLRRGPSECGMAVAPLFILAQCAALIAPYGPIDDDQMLFFEPRVFRVDRPFQFLEWLRYRFAQLWKLVAQCEVISGSDDVVI